MNSWIIFIIGGIAQLLFSARSIVQWFISEKQKKVLTPTGYWKLSLLASFLLFIYGYLRNDFAIMLGQSLTYFIYIRNMQLQGEWVKLNKFIRLFLYIFPVLILIYGYTNGIYDKTKLFQNENIPFWLFILGITSQLLFTFRFIFQWMYSEKKGKSSLPLGFWILSFCGSLAILVYGIFRKDPVLIVGHVFGLIMYGRNISFIRTKKV